MKKYVLASNDGNRNIAIIGVENSETMISDKDFLKRLEKALEEEFDNPVSIESMEQYHQTPIAVRVTVLIGEKDENQYSDVIELEETWVY